MKTYQSIHESLQEPFQYFFIVIQRSPNQIDYIPAICTEFCNPNNFLKKVKMFNKYGIIELFTNQLNPNEHPFYAEIYTHKVSAHFLIRRDGTLIQFVSCLNRSWHAGVSSWQGRERCNDFSVGIELEGSDFDAFESAQYLTLKTLISSLIKKYPIKAIVGHSDIAPVRKTDPGPYFNWSQINTLLT